MKFLRWLLGLLTKFSFIAYLCTLKGEVKRHTLMAGATVLKDKPEMEKSGREFVQAFSALEMKTQETSRQVGKHPDVKSSGEFNDDTGRSAAQHRNYQLSVLRTTLSCQRAIDNDVELLSAAHERYREWVGKMACVVSVRAKKHVKNELLEKLAAEDFGLSASQWKSEIVSGGKINLEMTYSDAQYLSELLKSYGIKAYFSLAELKKAEQRCVPDGEDIKDAYSSVALHQRLLLCGLYLALLAVVFVVNGAVFSSEIIILLVGCVVLFFALWGISALVKLVVANLAAALMVPILRSVKEEYMPLVSSYVYEEMQGVYETTALEMQKRLIASLGTTNESYGRFKAYTKKFLPDNIIDGGWLPFICNQMETGASYNEAVWRAQQVQDRERWKEERRKRDARRDKEAREYRQKMLNEQKRQTELARERAAAAEAAAASAASAAYEMRQIRSEEERQTQVLKDIRRDLTGYM